MSKARNEPVHLPMWLGPQPTRAECRDGLRPCPWRKCPHNLRHLDGADRPGRRWGGKHPPDLDLLTTGAVLEDTCELDVIERNPDGMTLDEVGSKLQLTRERVRQIEKGALAKLGIELADEDEG